MDYQNIFAFCKCLSEASLNNGGKQRKNNIIKLLNIYQCQKVVAL